MYGIYVYGIYVYGIYVYELNFQFQRTPFYIICQDIWPTTETIRNNVLIDTLLVLKTNVY